MAVRMRLMRMGKKKQPMYRVVVVDGRSQRDSRYIEQIGRYEPLHDPSLIEIDNEKAAAWLAKGAQPSETVEKLLNISGVMNTMKIRTGQIHVVGVEKAPQPEPVAESVVEQEPAAEAAEDHTSTSEEE
jgi:small subunit ribosomal protein S16